MDVMGKTLAEDGPAATTPDTIAVPRAEVVPLLRNDDGEVLLVDVGRRAVHTVNMTGGMIWAQCDGQQTVAEITTALAGMFSTQPEVISPDVIRSITDFRNFGLLRTDDDPPFPDGTSAELQPGPDGSSYVVPSPCNCGLDLETLAWAGTFAVAVGPIRMGIRYDSESTGAVVREALQDWIIDDEDVPITFTIVLPGDEPSDERLTRSGLYEGRRFQNGPSDHDGIVAMLKHRVVSWRPLSGSEVRIGAIGLDGPNGIALVPAMYGLDPQLMEHAERSGGRFVPSPVIVDSEAGTIDGRPIAGIVWPDAETERLAPDATLRRLVGLVDVHAGDDAEACVDALDALATGVNALTTPSDQITDVAAALVRPR